MERRRLAGTDLEVSRLCFGTMTFGKPVEQAEATKMVDCCLEAGINFFDTANVYQQGISEQLLGVALKGRRDQVILASKVRGKMGEGPDQVGLSRRAIVRAVEESLKRLQTDYLDLYYLHQPDYEVSIEETMETLDELVRKGLIRYPATSNYASWQVCQMLTIAGQKGYEPVRIAQQMWNLLARGLEQEFVPFAKKAGVSIIAYNPLAGGLLSGKHSAQASYTPGTRFDGNKMYQDRYWHQQNFQAVEELKQIAARAGRSIISLAFNWLLHHTASDCVILGATRLAQLEQNLAACSEGALSDETVAACDEVWQKLRGPVPVYNR
jgi:1-deoxyxylulose-5-phosphate synthase